MFVDAGARPGRAGRRHGRLQRRRGGQRHGHHAASAAELGRFGRATGQQPQADGRASAAPWTSEARSTTPTAPSSTPRRRQPAVRRHGHDAGGGGVLRQPRARRPMSATRALYRLRGGQLRAAHARPFAAAGADRQRHDHRPSRRAFSQNKNLVTRGARRRARRCEPEIHDYDVLPGDLYLLCSDGLNDMVEDEDIELHAADAAAPTCELAATQLVQMANDNGGRDNVSVILVRGPRRVSGRRAAGAQRAGVAAMTK
ncbi:MAG: hypothetical protein MZW92_17910 [Comamonadaceae bacterium]|nr:hypothetical protein [Comamonadaceae bacterium]